ncbi:G-protein coupled receptor 35 isoform X3 [Oreochromis niloticus]|uniref:G-protein coupled receptor 35 n=1 Tax=Oreochromis niloticus TaxID=8128 RepID=I3KGP5_ORENI|nr:G-protein coupled receptor 35 isoform X3 [Oreochromis niloticus]
MKQANSSFELRVFVTDTETCWCSSTLNHFSKLYEEEYISAGPQILNNMSANVTVCNITTNCSTNCIVDYLQGLGYAALFLLGFLINAAALYAFIAIRRSWTDIHIYMLNLNIADFSLILFLSFRIYDAFSCLPITYFCTFLMYVHFLNMYASIFTTAAISVQRYLSIRFPLRARSWKWKKQTAFAVCLVIWVFLITACIMVRKDNYPEKLWTCFERCKNIPHRTWSITSVIFIGFLIPLLIVVFCSTQIIRMFLKEADKSEEKKNIVGIVTANMIVFIVCYTPIHIAFVADLFDEPQEDWICESTTVHKYLLWSEWIAGTNCCFDSISYFFLLKGFFFKST